MVLMSTGGMTTTVTSGVTIIATGMDTGMIEVGIGIMTMATESSFM